MRKVVLLPGYFVTKPRTVVLIMRFLYRYVFKIYLEYSYLSPSMGRGMRRFPKWCHWRTSPAPDDFRKGNESSWTIRKLGNLTIWQLGQFDDWGNLTIGAIWQLGDLELGDSASCKCWHWTRFRFSIQLILRHDYWFSTSLFKGWEVSSVFYLSVCVFLMLCAGALLLVRERGCWRTSLQAMILGSAFCDFVSLFVCIFVYSCVLVRYCWWRKGC